SLGRALADDPTAISDRIGRQPGRSWRRSASGVRVTSSSDAGLLTRHHLVGHSEQQAAVAAERVVAHAEMAVLAEGCASGTLHTLENPCDSIPNAVLALVVEFAKPTTAVSSTRAGAPSCFSSLSDSSSVTRGGVSLIASAYSITS